MAKKNQTIAKAGFIESMECLPVTKLPEGPEWSYEIKLDGYRLEAVKTGGETMLYSRRRNVLNRKFPYIAAALKDLPDETILDGEIVAMDAKAVLISTCCRTSAQPRARFITTPLTCLFTKESF